MAQNQAWPVHERIRAASRVRLLKREASKQSRELFSSRLIPPANNTIQEPDYHEA
ncbi:hypothetical protein VCR4J5_200063 [Vibrio crassostreae]|uniref:Uncharacterized protein n=1 Tax=Vibrio crassostreae TaxID=246167 RepID=A0A822N6X8_9VIBR|nr:hypothetical protein VCR4J5_200063 [Vibrio crassostreae]CDT48750.1 hypothetical protein VCR19J5_560063 [Vibrio crassostreae]CDT58416.1 hypothetical protein VCR5J5_720040 [Vibrio crassostreae]